MVFISLEAYMLCAYILVKVINYQSCSSPGVQPQSPSVDQTCSIGAWMVGRLEQIPAAVNQTGPSTLGMVSEPPPHPLHDHGT